MDAGKLIKTIRLEMGLKQIPFATLTKLDRSTLQNLEHGRNPPSVDSLEKVAAVAPQQFSAELKEAIKAAIKRNTERVPIRALVFEIPEELAVKLEKVAISRGVLDTRDIIPEVFSRGLLSLSQEAARTKHAKRGKEAHRREHPRS